MQLISNNLETQKASVIYFVDLKTNSALCCSAQNC